MLAESQNPCGEAGNAVKSYPESVMHNRISGELKALGIPHRNNVALLDPFGNQVFADLIVYTANKKPVILVEFKADSTSQSIMTALGQVLTYSELLGMREWPESDYQLFICAKGLSFCAVDDIAMELGVEMVPEHKIVEAIQDSFCGFDPDAAPPKSQRDFRREEFQVVWNEAAKRNGLIC
jgi:hypothetical protein